MISDGANTKYGSLFSSYDFFYAWRKINDDDEECDGISSLINMIKGLFKKERLLSVIKDFIYFPDATEKDLKIVCRYPQFYATNKLFNNIKAHIRPFGDGKGGTYFGATGCGKSYTMLFLTRLLMKSAFFRSPTIVVITDRTDLDDQLSKQFINSKRYIGDDSVINIESREKLKEELHGRESGGVYLTTIQKFTEDLDILTDRSNAICISDEAHRSQINLDQKIRITESGIDRKYGFAKYLHDSLPNATYVGFTGTPVDKIEKYYSQCAVEGANEHQIEESKRAVVNMDAIIGDPDIIQAVAEDFIKHYENRVSEGATVAGKAMFVCSNRHIAYNLYKKIVNLRPKWAEKKIIDGNINLTEKEKNAHLPKRGICV